MKKENSRQLIMVFMWPIKIICVLITKYRNAILNFFTIILILQVLKHNSMTNIYTSLNIINSICLLFLILVPLFFISVLKFNSGKWHCFLPLHLEIWPKYFPDLKSHQNKYWKNSIAHKVSLHFSKHSFLKKYTIN